MRACREYAVRLTLESPGRRVIRTDMGVVLPAMLGLGTGAVKDYQHTHRYT